MRDREPPRAVEAATVANAEVCIQWQPAQGVARRYLFLPRDRGESTYLRVEQRRRDDGAWQTAGEELVEQVRVYNEGGGDA